MRGYIVVHDGVGGRFSKGDMLTRADLAAYLAGRGVKSPADRQATIDRLIAVGAIEPRPLPPPARRVSRRP